MRLSSWSSSSITAARGYICSMSKWNCTPAGGSLKKFLLSCDQRAQFQQNRSDCSSDGPKRDTSVECLYLQLTGQGSAAGWCPPHCSRPREAQLRLYIKNINRWYSASFISFHHRSLADDTLLQPFIKHLKTRLFFLR